MQNFLIVMAGSALGGGARYALNNLVGSLFGTGFPWGILIINILGSTAIGVFMGVFAFASAPHSATRLFCTAGLCGGFTTFSAFSLDAVALYDRGEITLAALYVVGSVVLSILGLVSGLALTRVMMP